MYSATWSRSLGLQSNKARLFLLSQINGQASTDGSMKKTRSQIHIISFSVWEWKTDLIFRVW